VTLIRLGWTATRDGMTREQMLSVYQYIVHAYFVPDPGVQVEAHHGDCRGGDAEFHVIATVLGCRTVVHPPENSRLRAWCKADEIRAPKGYLARDWDIASETAELLAAPKAWAPVAGSGTWTTTGYGVRLGRPVTVFLPDGSWRPGTDFFRAHERESA
jgi:hypothetical protein